MSTTSSRVSIDLADTATAWDTAVEWMLGVMLVFMPAVNGVVTALDRAIVVALALAVAACLVAKRLTRPDVRQVWSWGYLPIAAFLLIAAMQLVQLPINLLRSLSPATADTK